MKLIFCRKCQDIIRLFSTWRQCQCGEVGGRYVNNIDAEMKGDGIPIGFANHSFVMAIKNQQIHKSVEFTAFVIEKECPTVRRTV